MYKMKIQEKQGCEQNLSGGTDSAHSLLYPPPPNEEKLSGNISIGEN